MVKMEIKIQSMGREMERRPKKGAIKNHCWRMEGNVLREVLVPRPT